MQDYEMVSFGTALFACKGRFRRRPGSVLDQHQRAPAAHDCVDAIDCEIPTLAANGCKYAIGRSVIYPKKGLKFGEKSLYMCFGVPCEEYKIARC